MSNSRFIVDPVEYETKISKENKEYVKMFILEKKAQNLSVNTVKQYEQDMRIILTYLYRDFDNISLIKLKKKHILSLSVMLQEERGLSPNRVARLLSSLRCCLSTLADNEDVEDYNWSVGTKIKNPKIELVRSKTYLREEHIEWLSEYLLSQGKILECLYLSMSFVSGKRKSEIFQIEKHHLTSRLFTNTVRGKGAKLFKIYFTESVQQIIKQYLELRGEDEYDSLWVKLYKNGSKKPLSKATFNEWTSLFSQLLSNHFGVELYFRPHDIRRSRLSTLRDAGVSIEKLSKFANHGSTSVTQIYLEPKDDDIADILGIELDEKIS